MIRQLSFNYLPLADLDHRTGGGRCAICLTCLFRRMTVHSRAVRSLIGCNTTPVTRRLPGSGLLVYGRGVSCELTVDEEGFSGISPYLFGLVLEHYIARHVSINTFSQMTLHSMQRGKIMTACQGGTAGKRMSDDFTQAEKPRRYGFLNLMRRVDVQLCTVPAGNTGNHGWKNFASDKRPR